MAVAERVRGAVTPTEIDALLPSLHPATRRRVGPDSVRANRPAPDRAEDRRRLADAISTARLIRRTVQTVRATLGPADRSTLDGLVAGIPVSRMAAASGRPERAFRHQPTSACYRLVIRFAVLHASTAATH
jgi:hypothetical protein